MALEATDELPVRVATIAEAIVKQFGADAIHVAKDQARLASSDGSERWIAVVEYLKKHTNEPLTS